MEQKFFLPCHDNFQLLTHVGSLLHTTKVAMEVNAFEKWLHMDLCRHYVVVVPFVVLFLMLFLFLNIVTLMTN